MREPYFPQEETRDLQNRIYWLLGIILLALTTLLLRAWYLQVVQGKRYLELSENNRIRVVKTHPPRGLIYDRNGVLLVNNVPTFNLYVVLEDMSDSKRVLNRVADLLEISREEMGRRILSKREDPYLPIKIKDDLSMKEVAQIEGHTFELPGVKIEAEFKRNAIYGMLAAHLFGYVGEISQNQIDSTTYPNAEGGAIVGQYGIEQTYDKTLRGVPGQKGIEVDAMGHEMRLLKVKEPIRGDDLFLSIDINVQKAAEEALGNEAGAIVAIDPHTGEVLAMTSHPAFNPNVLSEGASSQAWAALLTDERRPLTNRATQGQYPPGSTFKIVMGAALLESKEITADRRVECRGFLPFGNRNFKDWKRGGHGSVDLHRAIVESCDVYFYEMGNRLGIDTISKFAKLFGLGQPTGIELAFEKGGLIPSSEWKRTVRKEPWFPGETLSVSIGQGYVSTTPLQLGMMIGAVAADGVLHPPRLLKKIRNHETGAIQEIEQPAAKRLPFSTETFQILQSALAGVVSEPGGTAASAKSPLVSIGGKTGTAQVVSLKNHLKSSPSELNDHAWFVSFAPIENPQIAVVVLVEHGGHGGSTAAPLARKVIEAYVAGAAPAPPPPVKPRRAAVSPPRQG